MQEYILKLMILLILLGCEKKSQTIVPVSNSTPSIIGGKFEDTEKILNGVYKLLMRIDNYSNCTAVQIDEQHLLTATHCLVSSEKGYAPSHKYLEQVLSNRKASSNISLYAPPVHRYSFNPGFNSTVSFHNDLSLVNFGRKIFNNKDNFLLPLKNSDLPEELYISGLGSTSSHSDTSFDEMALKTLAVSKKMHLLHEITPEMVPKDLYLSESQYIRDINMGIKKKNMYCFKTNSLNETPAFGDSGGPLYSLDSAGNPILQGIFSSFIWDSEGITIAYCYTRIDDKIDWIQNYKEHFFSTYLVVKSGAFEKKIDSIIMNNDSAGVQQYSSEIVNAGNGEKDQIKNINLKNKVALIRLPAVDTILTRIKIIDAAIENLSQAGAVGVIMSIGKGEEDYKNILSVNKFTTIGDLPIDVRIITDIEAASLLKMMTVDKVKVELRMIK